MYFFGKKIISYLQNPIFFSIKNQEQRDILNSKIANSLMWKIVYDCYNRFTTTPSEKMLHTSMLRTIYNVRVSQYSLPMTQYWIYSIRNVNCRFLVLAVNIGSVYNANGEGWAREVHGIQSYLPHVVSHHLTRPLHTSSTDSSLSDRLNNGKSRHTWQIDALGMWESLTCDYGISNNHHQANIGAFLFWVNKYIHSREENDYSFSPSSLERRTNYFVRVWACKCAIDNCAVEV